MNLLNINEEAKKVQAEEHSLVWSLRYRRRKSSIANRERYYRLVSIGEDGCILFWNIAYPTCEGRNRSASIRSVGPEAYDLSKLQTIKPAYNAHIAKNSLLVM